MNKISICIPTYERDEILLESFSEIISDDRVSEIIILDDCSSNFNEIQQKINNLNNSKFFYQKMIKI